MMQKKLIYADKIRMVSKNQPDLRHLWRIEFSIIGAVAVLHERRCD